MSHVAGRRTIAVSDPALPAWPGRRRSSEPILPQIGPHRLRLASRRGSSSGATSATSGGGGGGGGDKLLSPQTSRRRNLLLAHNATALYSECVRVRTAAAGGQTSRAA